MIPANSSSLAPPSFPNLITEERIMYKEKVWRSIYRRRGKIHVFFPDEGEGSEGRCYYELNVVEIAWQVYAILRGIPADISVRIKR